MIPAERAVCFGPEGYLVGIWTPVLSRQRDRPAFIFLNAGLVHHVGPSRTYVVMARRLAALGYPSLRFDLGGIGDSGSEGDAASFEESSARETRIAMDLVRQEFGVRSFILVGICSGARLALQVGADDERVVGVVSLDGQRFRTRRFWVERFRARRRSVLSALLLRRPRSGRGGGPAHTKSTLEAGLITLPLKPVVEARLHALVSNGVHQYWVFTGSFPEKYNYTDQHRDAFKSVDFGELLRVDYLPEAGHLLVRGGDQRYVVDNVVEWATSIWS